MDRQKLLGMINTAIDEVSIEMFRKGVTPQKTPFRKTEVNEEDFDELLFPKKDSDDRQKYIIKESTEVPQILASEIKEFESDFQSVAQDLGATLTFTPQANGHSIVAILGSDGIEVVSSGCLNFGNDGKIYWDFSLLNGASFASENLMVTNSTKDLTTELFKHYDAWKSEWREKLSKSPDSEGDMDMEAPPEQALAPIPAAPPVV